jgi:hypothetical protein
MNQLELRIPRTSNTRPSEGHRLLEALQSECKDDKQTESPIAQEEVVLYRDLKLWGPLWPTRPYPTKGI